MKISDERLHEVMSKFIAEKGLEGAIEYVSTSDYPADVKDRAMKILKGDPQTERVLAEHGDISDAG